MSDSNIDTNLDRGQASIIGTLLVISIVAVVSIATVGLAVSVIDQSTEEAETSSAELTYSQYASEINSISSASSSDGVATVAGASEISSNSKLIDDGIVSIEIQNNEEEDIIVVDEMNVGALKYENPDTGDEIIYQSGGVWQHNEGGSQIISYPEMGIRGDTVNFPLIRMVEHEVDELGSDLTAEQISSERRFPRESMFDENPIVDGEVVVEVESKYYEAWAESIDRNFDGEIDVFPEEERVFAILESEPEDVHFETSSSTEQSGTELDFNNPTDIFSYDSYEQNPTGQNENAEVVFGSDVNINSPNTVIGGDVKSLGYITIDHQNSRIGGDVICGGGSNDCVNDENTVDGDITSGDVEINIPSTEPFIESTLASFSGDNNNNDDVESINENGLWDGGNNEEIESGEYLIKDDANIDSDITFDTSDGDIIIAVDGDIDSSATFNIEGDGRIEFYVSGDINLENFESSTDHPEYGEKYAQQLWMYTHDSSIQIDSPNTDVVGIFYASEGDGISIEQNTNVWGGLYGVVDDVSQGNTVIHFDEQLIGSSPFESLKESDSISYITDIYTDITEIGVSNVHSESGLEPILEPDDFQHERPDVEPPSTGELPTINVLSTDERPDDNEIDVDWEVSYEEGKLESKTLRLIEGGTSLDSESSALSGNEETGSTTLSYEDGDEPNEVFMQVESEEDEVTRTTPVSLESEEENGEEENGEEGAITTTVTDSSSVGSDMVSVNWEASSDNGLDSVTAKLLDDNGNVVGDETDGLDGEEEVNNGYIEVTSGAAENAVEVELTVEDSEENIASDIQDIERGDVNIEELSRNILINGDYVHVDWNIEADSDIESSILESTDEDGNQIEEKDLDVDGESGSGSDLIAIESSNTGDVNIEVDSEQSGSASDSINIEREPRITNWEKETETVNTGPGQGQGGGNQEQQVTINWEAISEEGIASGTLEVYENGELVEEKEYPPNTESDTFQYMTDDTDADMDATLYIEDEDGNEEVRTSKDAEDIIG